MTSRIRKITYSTIAGVGLFAGAAGLSAAATGNGSDQAPPSAVTPAAEAESNEVDDGVDHQFEGEEVGENGDGVADADDANETEVDPAAASVNGLVAAPADEATEAPDIEAVEADEADSDEVDDGVDHQFEGEEVGENGNGIADADDANETEADD